MKNLLLTLLVLCISAAAMPQQFDSQNSNDAYQCGLTYDLMHPEKNFFEGNCNKQNGICYCCYGAGPTIYCDVAPASKCKAIPTLK